MTHFSDGLSVGAASTNYIVGSTGGFGVDCSQSYLNDIVPLTKNAAAYAASQSPGAAALTLSASTGVTAIVTNGVTRYTCDVARCVTVTSGGNDTGITFLISGYDAYGALLTQKLTGVSGSVATTKKAFLSVVSIVPSGAVASTVSAGTADTFGLPVRLIDKGYLGALNWNNTYAIDSGVVTVADTTSPATNLTGDVRGTYTTSTASDGVKRSVVEIMLSNAQLSITGGVAATVAVVGVTQA